MRPATQQPALERPSHQLPSTHDQSLGRCLAAGQARNQHPAPQPPSPPTLGPSLQNSPRRRIARQPRAARANQPARRLRPPASQPASMWAGCPVLPPPADYRKRATRRTQAPPPINCRPWHIASCPDFTVPVPAAQFSCRRAPFEAQPFTPPKHSRRMPAPPPIGAILCQSHPPTHVHTTPTAPHAPRTAILACAASSH